MERLYKIPNLVPGYIHKIFINKKNTKLYTAVRRSTGITFNSMVTICEFDIISSTIFKKAKTLTYSDIIINTQDE